MRKGSYYIALFLYNVCPLPPDHLTDTKKRRTGFPMRRESWLDASTLGEAEQEELTVLRGCQLKGTAIDRSPVTR